MVFSTNIPPDQGHRPFQRSRRPTGNLPRPLVIIVASALIVTVLGYALAL